MKIESFDQAHAGRCPCGSDSRDHYTHRYYISESGGGPMFKKSFYTRIAKELAESGNEIKSAKAHKEIKTMETKVTEFKGRNVLQIIGNGEDKFPFTFGLRKAKLILEAVEEIKMFVAAEESKAPAEKPAKKTKKTVAKSPAVVLETV